ncbi:MAG: ornithine cyclodeaminase [Xanthobacteraceae bacterium]|jgi:ornithine cyclodeaminase/alanine dehydrogenase-like protein (mu-crystallin family)|nr:ornithine cyclodeaminase [Xanthobacteraceae bacterium]
MPHEVVFLSDQDVSGMFTMADAMVAVEDDFKRQGVPESMIYGVPLSYVTEDRKLGYRSRIKSAIIRDLPVAGVRVTGFNIDQNGVGTGGERAATRYIILSDPVTSSPIAIIDEHSSFSKRTGASVCVAAKYLARPESATVGIIGVGNVGQAALQGLHALFNISDVKATSLRPQSREKFAHEMSHTLGLRVRAVDSYEEACRGADIIVVGTSSPEPFLHYDWLEEGVFLAVVGEHEAMNDVYVKCDRFFVDYNPASEKHPAHIQHAVDAGAIGTEDITGQLWEVIAGRKPGRRNAKEKVLVASVGLTTQDISIAYQLYMRAKAEGLGMRLPF